MIPLTVPLREERSGYADVWHVQPPPFGMTFAVTQCEWNRKWNERHIYEWSSIEQRFDPTAAPVTPK